MIIYIYIYIYILKLDIPKCLAFWSRSLKQPLDASTLRNASRRCRRWRVATGRCIAITPTRRENGRDLHPKRRRCEVGYMLRSKFFMHMIIYIYIYLKMCVYIHTYIDIRYKYLR